MLKAEQSALIHQANINVVGIRSAEIQYFSQFFSSFGVQAALIAGFSINSVSQVPALDADCNASWKYIYWITAAITFTAAMHVIICSVYISVFGQGMALRGPLGSMVIAVEGMVVEQEQVVNAFLITIVALAFNLVGTYGVMMDLTGALISSAITIIGLGFWYHFTLRIYNRFKFAEQSTKYQDDDENELDEHFPDPDGQGNPLQGPKFQAKKEPKKLKVKKTTTFSKFLFGKKGKKGGSASDSNSVKSGSDNGDSASIGGDDPTAEASKASVFSGHLTMKTSSMLGTNWVRRFFVLKGYYAMYYTDKSDYEKKPLESINKRPISFADYAVDIAITEEYYALELTPLDPEDERKAWEFRCDTKSELEAWRQAFLKGITGLGEGQVAAAAGPIVSSSAASSFASRDAASSFTSRDDSRTVY